MTESLLIAQALATVSMAGVIWTMQLVHYALFAQVGSASFAMYQREHMRRISWVVGPLMIVEAGAALWLALDRPPGIPSWATASGGALVCIIWLSTGLLQGPTHTKLLREGAEPRRLRFLLATNWIRTVAWSARAPLALLMLVWGTQA